MNTPCRCWSCYLTVMSRALFRWAKAVTSCCRDSGGEVLINLAEMINTGNRLRSCVLEVMSLARYHCAMPATSCSCLRSLELWPSVSESRQMIRYRGYVSIVRPRGYEPRALPLRYPGEDTSQRTLKLWQDPSYYIKDTRVIYMVKRKNRINFIIK